MKLEEIRQILANETHFDLAFLVQISGERRHTALIQLSRWMKKGAVIPLKRGLYTLGEKIHKDFNPAEFAHIIYQPSYLSLEWALSCYGLIPEQTITWTSVTTRVTRQFKNDYGIFTYQKMHPKLFWGFSEKIWQNRPVFLAHPEKALLDYFYLQPGEWTIPRLFEMRFQNFEILNAARWQDFVTRFDSPRISRASKRFLELLQEEKKGCQKI